MAREGFTDDFPLLQGPWPDAIWTIGHSSLALDAFLALLSAHGITAIADVRRFPGSRRHPHFAREALERTLPEAGIDYAWLPQLGGRRRARADSPNTAWRNDSFRGYADHLDSGEFAAGWQALLALAAVRPTALMCAEALWWQCHRALISDVLKLHGIAVRHVRGPGPPELHPWSGAASVAGGHLSYAAAQGALGF
jgi:uncharacterized protein (DUF488 family)